MKLEQARRVTLRQHDLLELSLEPRGQPRPVLDLGLCRLTSRSLRLPTAVRPEPFTPAVFSTAPGIGVRSRHQSVSFCHHLERTLGGARAPPQQSHTRVGLRRLQQVLQEPAGTRLATCSSLPCHLGFHSSQQHLGAPGPETHQKGRGFGMRPGPTSPPSPAAPRECGQACSPAPARPSSALTVVMSRLSPHAVMAAESKRQPRRQRGPQRRTNSGRSM